MFLLMTFTRLESESLIESRSINEFVLLRQVYRPITAVLCVFFCTEKNVKYVRIPKIVCKNALTDTMA